MYRNMGRVLDKIADDYFGSRYRMWQELIKYYDTKITYSCVKNWDTAAQGVAPAYAVALEDLTKGAYKCWDLSKPLEYLKPIYSKFNPTYD